MISENQFSSIYESYCKSFTIINSKIIAYDWGFCLDVGDTRDIKSYLRKDYTNLIDEIIWDSLTNTFKQIIDQQLYELTPNPNAATTLYTDYNITSSKIITADNITTFRSDLNQLTRRRKKKTPSRRGRKKIFIRFSNQILPPSRSLYQQLPPLPPPRSYLTRLIVPLSRPAFTEHQKTSSNPKTETKIEEEVDESSPALKEKYKPPKNAADMKEANNYKEDVVPTMNCRKEIERARKEVEKLRDRLSNIETRVVVVEGNIEDINSKAFELRKDVDTNNKYTKDLIKNNFSPKKVAKYFHFIFIFE
ncbi:hypothetical protein M9Y10_009894 [Tritrichomonas musculus]|uniref:Uncharacterized protein n=1 Tax=Tritrichomonas musculus TaxID=1915356 RepID=A0ABR2IQS8_9EUKA